MDVKKALKIKRCKTYTAEVYMAGDINFARQSLQVMFSHEGMCASLELVDYVYTGGMERGFVVRIINYPRFPSDPSKIKEAAFRISEKLINDLGQGSCTIVCQDETIFMSRREND